MVNKSITSTSNPLIKKISLLQTKKSARKKENTFVIEGLRGVNEIPNVTWIKELIVSEQVNVDEITLAVEEIITVPEDVYKHISDTKSPQGVLATVAMCHQTLEEINVQKDGFYMVLENVQDPGNLGTIIRTAYGFGVDAIFLTKGCVDVYNPKTIRSTMGALLHLPIVIDLEIEEIIGWFKQHDIPLYATDLAESKPVADYVLTGGVGIAIGNEANGISETLRQGSDYKMRIPMPGGLESLNASIAGSICMYEVMRQRQTSIDK
ncbi:MAG: TrmH family RNA methyltransferase [Cellulosilyticaceae bacterium]